MGGEAGGSSLEETRLVEDMTRARETVQSQLATIDDLGEQLSRALVELNESRDRERALQFELDARGRPGMHSRLAARGWAALRWIWRRVPLGLQGRERAKARFYAGYGRIFPSSTRYRTYRAIQESVEASAAARLERVVKPSPDGEGSAGWDVLVFPVIDWHFRHQRPQQLALELGRQGHRVFYFATTFVSDGGNYEPQAECVSENVYLVTLPCNGRPPVIYEETLGQDQLATVLHGVKVVRRTYDIGSVVALVDHPFWAPVAEKLPNSALVYDCMDHHGGFANTAGFVAEYEEQLLRSAPLVVVSSSPLMEVLGKTNGSVSLVRNGTEYGHFAEPPEDLAISTSRVVVGYYGAIAEWFDVDLMYQVAVRLPQFEFHLVGDSTGADTAALSKLENVFFHGEVPYGELPRFVHAFDVCLIPFKLVELTRCTNPVKVYEYLSAGKPVVSTRLPEVEAMGSVVRIGSTPDEFAEQVVAALSDGASGAIDSRRSFARENTWASRGEHLAAEMEKLFPKVSVIVLCFNQLELTQACVDGLFKFTDYPNWELILVDNASSDGTREWMEGFAKERPNVRVVLNDANLGFSAGNNRGAEVAEGEWLVFLNNDTYVTRGWMGDLLAHFARDSRLGAVGPVTNNIGNEARIDIGYESIDEMHGVARRHTDVFRGQSFEIPMLAFFCVMIPSAVWADVGPLDEQFGRGFFEDDDFAMRLRERGYGLACAEDVFVHHHLSGTFEKMAQQARDELFLRNKALFEQKWGPWTPHRYRGA